MWLHDERLPDCPTGVLHISDGARPSDEPTGQELDRFSGGGQKPGDGAAVCEFSGCEYRSRFDGGGNGDRVPAGDVGVVVGRLSGDRDVSAVAVPGAEALEHSEAAWPFHPAGFSGAALRQGGKGGDRRAVLVRLAGDSCGTADCDRLDSEYGRGDSEVAGMRDRRRGGDCVLRGGGGGGVVIFEYVRGGGGDVGVAAGGTICAACAGRVGARA